MKTMIYMGSFKLLEKSGIGRAMLHQKAILESKGIEVTDKMEKDVDTVHINTVMLNSVFTAIKARLKKKKVIYYGHSTMEDFRNSFKGSNLLAPLFKQWIRFCYSLGHVIITPTEYSKSILDGYGLDKDIYALSNGIDTEFFSVDKKLNEGYHNHNCEDSHSYGENNNGRLSFREKYPITPNQKVVISVGHFIERKGILDFIEAAIKMPETRFIWFGHTNLNLIPDKIKTAIEDAPSNLTFAGYVTREALRDAYREADLFAFMSHEETEGIVVLEALACGIPTLVRDIPVYEGWLEDGVNVHKARGNDMYLSKMKGILAGTESNLGEEGHAVADSRSISAVGDRLLGIYAA